MNELASATPAFLLQVHEKLCTEYHCPISYFGNRDPLSQLVSSLLSQRTTNKNKGIAFKALRAALPEWSQVRDAPEEQVRELIKPCTWPEQKAPRIQALLREIEARTGGLSLDFLADLEVAAARRWLESLHGIGPKTSAAVLSFSNLRQKALPVDAHHYRVALRLGMIAPTVDQAKAHDLLGARVPADWQPQDYYDHHEVMMFHGQKCCYFKKPACGRCLLLTLCGTGQTRMENADVPEGKPHVKTATP